MNSNKINVNLLLDKIKSLEENNNKSRKITKKDLNYLNSNFKKTNKNENKVKDYRMQEEYGEKKFIKP